MRPWVASGLDIYYNGVVKKIPPVGPAPAPLPESPPVEVTDPSRRRLLHLVAEHAVSAPPTVGDLVATVGGHPNTTRHHLRVLVDAGLLAEVYIRMTRGQDSLVIDEVRSERTEIAVEAVDFASLELVVIEADPAEAQAHEKLLAELDKASGGKLVWKAPAEAAVA